MLCLLWLCDGRSPQFDSIGVVRSSPKINKNAMTNITSIKSTYSTSCNYVHFMLNLYFFISCSSYLDLSLNVLSILFLVHLLQWNLLKQWFLYHGSNHDLHFARFQLPTATFQDDTLLQHLK